MKIFNGTNTIPLMFLTLAANIVSARFFFIPLWNYYDIGRSIDLEILYDPRWQDLIILFPVSIQSILFILLVVSFVRISWEVKAFSQKGIIYCLGFFLMVGAIIGAIVGLLSYLVDRSVDDLIAMSVYSIILLPIPSLFLGLTFGLKLEFSPTQKVNI